MSQLNGTHPSAERINEALSGKLGQEQLFIAQVGLDWIAKLLRKNADYGGSVFKSPVMAPGLPPTVAIDVRISDKISRLISLTERNPEIIDESRLDTLDDLAAYAILRNVAVRLNNTVVQMNSDKQRSDKATKAIVGSLKQFEESLKQGFIEIDSDKPLSKEAFDQLPYEIQQVYPKELKAQFIVQGVDKQVQDKIDAACSAVEATRFHAGRPVTVSNEELRAHQKNESSADKPYVPLGPVPTSLSPKQVPSKPQACGQHRSTDTEDYLRYQASISPAPHKPCTMYLPPETTVSPLELTPIIVRSARLRTGSVGELHEDSNVNSFLSNKDRYLLLNGTINRPAKRYQYAVVVLDAEQRIRCHASISPAVEQIKYLEAKGYRCILAQINYTDDSLNLIREYTTAAFAELPIKSN